MTERGRPNLESEIGPERMKELLKTYDVDSISELLCKHEVSSEHKRKCEACHRAVYRAKARLIAAEKQDKTFEAMDAFAEIPEIKNLVAYQKGKGAGHKKIVDPLRRMWTWIRESGDSYLVETQRPIMWNERHIQFILAKIDTERMGRYGWIQSLRRLYESMKRSDMLSNPLLKARRVDMRSPNGASREIDRFTPSQFKQILESCDTEEERFIVKLHVTLKSREGNIGAGSLLGLKWGAINWTDTFYGVQLVTVTVYEPKTAGGTQWEHCPVDLWFSQLSEDLRKRFEIRPGYSDGTIVGMDYPHYLAVWAKINQKLGTNYQPHDCRRSPSGWLRDLGLSDLAIGQYSPTTGKAVGYTGVGWENAEIYFTRYGKLNPLALFDKSQRLDISFFDGLINKIVENRK